GQGRPRGLMQSQRWGLVVADRPSPRRRRAGGRHKRGIETGEGRESFPISFADPENSLRSPLILRYPGRMDAWADGDTVGTVVPGGAGWWGFHFICGSGSIRSEARSSFDTSGRTGVGMESFDTSGRTGVGMESFDTSGRTGVGMESFDTSGRTGVCADRDNSRGWGRSW